MGRRRSSVRFEDEIAEQKPPSQKIESIPIIKIDEPEEKPSIPIVENINDLQRNVSFRNNEDDLWTTITINSEQSSPVQSSHYNRLTLENLSSIDTSVTNSNNGVTAILVNSTTIESASPEKVEEETPTSSSPPPPPPPPPPPLPQTPSKPARHRHKPSPPTPSRSHTASSEDETDIRHIKPVEEIHTIVTDKYNYNNLSQALKSNVERLKNTFINAQEKQSPSDKPILPKNSSSTHSSDC